MIYPIFDHIKKLFLARILNKRKGLIVYNHIKKRFRVRMGPGIFLGPHDRERTHSLVFPTNFQLQYYYSTRPSLTSGA
jgi:hypothetical protein